MLEFQPSTGRLVAASYRLIMGTPPHAYAEAVAAPIDCSWCWGTSGVNVTVLPSLPMAMVALCQPLPATCTAAHAHVPFEARSCATQSKIGASGPSPLLPRVCW